MNQPPNQAHDQTNNQPFVPTPQGHPQHLQGQVPFQPQGQMYPPQGNIPPVAPPPPVKQGMSTGVKVAIGCGVATFLGFLLLCGLLFAGGFWIFSATQTYQRAEYHKVGEFTVDSIKSVIGEREVVFFEAGTNRGFSHLRLEYSHLSISDKEAYFDHLLRNGFAPDGDAVIMYNASGTRALRVEFLTPLNPVVVGSVYIQYTEVAR